VDGALANEGHFPDVHFQHATGVTGKDCIPPVILASQPRLRVCFMDLISDNAGTDLLIFRGEKIGDICMI